MTNRNSEQQPLSFIGSNKINNPQLSYPPRFGYTCMNSQVTPLSYKEALNMPDSREWKSAVVWY
ncbi:hypothetical protein DERP_005386 [Dermatophagoides pteronyssinus]|uniref:Uncharacterized protein n=1 Tax=Dermatophagoides pteronyssinus TaxID=6956 RepID=A0ABQ8JMF5_DERPT|nr:hypothetical protein DERP_005386 [Dermatophagoides pteronyssinus]